MKGDNANIQTKALSSTRMSAFQFYRKIISAPFPFPASTKLKNRKDWIFIFHTRLYSFIGGGKASNKRCRVGV